MKFRVLLTVLCALALIAPTRSPAEWLLEGNAGVGMPTGDFGDDWGSGLLVGASLGYLSAPFEIGADVSWLQNDPAGEYADFLETIDGEGEFTFVQYGVHARWMSPNQSSLSPYVGVGVAAYSLKDELEDLDQPDESDELSSTAMGVNIKAGANYWFNPAWGLGLDVAYHAVWPDEDEMIYDNASFIGIQAGLRYKIGGTQ
jgi:opacity protein-like surface antigen